jgi:hypothetical protein
LGDHVFLFEKSSNTSIVLYDENIMCLKNKNDDSRNTLIYQMIKKVKETNNTPKKKKSKPIPSSEKNTPIYQENKNIPIIQEKI